MEPSDPTAAEGPRHDPRPTPLAIDLNEIPSPSIDSPHASAFPDALALVRKFHENPPQARGPPAEFPGEAGGGPTFACGLCGRPESRGGTMVCDGCERGFHLSCMKVRARQVVSVDDWLCGDCALGGNPSKRWPLGAASAVSNRGGVRLLDINSLPPTEGEGEGQGMEEVLSYRINSQGEDGSPHLPYAVQMAYSHVRHTGNGLDIRKDPSLAVKVSHGSLTPNGVAMSRILGNAVLNPQLIGSTSSNSALIMTTPMQAEIFLQALRDFLWERQIILQDGWSVEFKPCTNGYNAFSFFCSPDGKKFESMLDVARYLETASNSSILDIDDKSDRVALMQKGLPLRRRRRLLGTDNFVGSQDGRRSGCGSVPSPNPEVVDVMSNAGAAGLHVPESADRSTEPSVDLPVQYEDFFVLHFGKIDERPGYHDSKHIWPVGYKSCWHDKVTGSVFKCEIIDGGDSGPVFMVQRCPCSSSEIPNGSTVLINLDLEKDSNLEKSEVEAFPYDANVYEDYQFQLILSDPSASQLDLSSCLGESPHKFDCTGRAYQFHKDSAPFDKIGEFLVEGRSTSSVWTVVSATLVNACREAHRKTGSFRFFCNHSGDGSGLDIVHFKAGINGPMAKFCSSAAGIHGSSEIHSDSELETTCRDVEKWLDQDRFGLDLDFVQEVVEQLPHAQSCCQYVFSRSRPRSQVLLMSQLHTKRKHEEEMTQDNLTRKSKKSCRQDLLYESGLQNGFPPPGQPFSTRLPAELVGDVLQVWQVLLRFHEILGLDKPVTFEELEKELINPWYDGSNCLEKVEKEIQQDQDFPMLRTDATDSTALPVVSSISGPGVGDDISDSFTMIEVESSNEAAQARLASQTFDRCNGISLTKTHIALLKVLVVELQLKVASVIDPNFDGGDTRSRRGRKKDVDSSGPLRKTKIEMLPVNELTWPELARRYILSHLAMDGSFDSVEVISREGGKVFRCLQGDGGILCGSLTGVAGMEADAMLLAEAERQVSDSMKKEKENRTAECKERQTSAACETNMVNTGSLPEWAQLLEPVRKLPTNVGTRIRKCVYDALDKHPPEWARKILEHSISKEVYKGNASGPTKKAVLAVLAEVPGEGQNQRPEKGRREKNNKSFSGMIMKVCRSILRRAVAADDSKVFCNLLGTTLLGSNDNEDEGILGSPATVSRPLDFRVIDLKLAAGAYGTSHEAFLEDVREVWRNISNAYGERSDLMQLAEALSQNFESLYEEEVQSFLQKCEDLAGMESPGGAQMKELAEARSANDIPKAPWEEGVCKVCGIDKDDDSVLLCDSCDSEYHTYCLNPPLARIPEGNWYCPSCVLGQGRGHDRPPFLSACNQNIGKRFHDKDRSGFSMTLYQLASVMEEKEYWEFSIEERIFLLKFLCDEVLSTSIIREHLDQCMDTCLDLQQKLRSLAIELRNLKFREEELTVRAAREEVGAIFPANGRFICPSQGLSVGLNASGSFSEDDTAAKSNARLENGSEESGQHTKTKTDNRECELLNVKKSDSRNHQEDDPDLNASCGTEAQRSDLVKLVSEDFCASTVLSDNIKACSAEQALPLTTQLTADNSSTQQSYCAQNNVGAPQQAFSLEANSLKNEITSVQDNIANVESQLLKTSLRREYLGRDSTGCLYWVLGRSQQRPWLVVDGSMAFEVKTDGDHVDRHVGPASSTFPSYFEVNEELYTPFTWMSYESDAEILDLVGQFKCSDTRERELKDSILHWLRLRSQETKKSDINIGNSLQGQSECSNSGKGLSPCLTTKASSLLEKHYGAFSEPENSDNPKKRGKRAKLGNEEKMFRCECLEPVWPSRHHCLSCHQTFCSKAELEGHCDGRCTPSFAVSEESREIEKGNASDEDADIEVSKSGKVDGSRLIKFQRKGTACPFELEGVSRKFVMSTSNKELVKEIGLIASKGIPSFVPCAHANFLDPTLIVVPFEKEFDTEARPVSNEESLFTARPLYLLNGDLKALSVPQTCDDNSTCEEVKGNQEPTKCSTDMVLDEDGRPNCVIPEPALQPLVGKLSPILGLLKTNLLDMEAALLDEALRPSQANWPKRCAWRAFVKSAESIFEMIQGTIIFENMIKTDYLRNGWWYWSSLTAAARTSTMSSLALRIYSLDAAIIYDRAANVSDQIETPKVNKGTKRKKDTDG